MCCRYYFADDAKEFMKSLVVNAYDLDGISSADIHPDDTSPIVISREKQAVAEKMRWGFCSYRKNQLLINARAETVFEKPTFSRSVQSRRCIVICNHFYEWDKDKNIAEFHIPDKKAIALAGIYDLTSNENRFCVLTREAERNERTVHDRMPFILGRDQIKDWLMDGKRTREILSSRQPRLEIRREVEQLSLFQFM